MALVRLAVMFVQQPQQHLRSLGIHAAKPMDFAVEVYFAEVAAIVEIAVDAAFVVEFAAVAVVAEQQHHR